MLVTLTRNQKTLLRQIQYQGKRKIPFTSKAQVKNMAWIHYGRCWP